MINYKFGIKGITPLLMHSNNITERDNIEAIRKRVKGKPGDDRSPPETWKSYLYTDDTLGNICMPTENLMSMLRVGGAKMRFSGKETLKAHSQRITFDRLDYDLLVKDAVVSKAAIEAINSPEFTDHQSKVLGLGFRLSVKPCAVTGKSHTRVRPEFRKWSISGMFEIDDDDANILNLANLKALFTLCGKLVGLGDWRPSAPKSGQYGRFLAEVDRV